MILGNGWPCDNRMKNAWLSLKKLNYLKTRVMVFHYDLEFRNNTCLLFIWIYLKWVFCDFSTCWFLSRLSPQNKFQHVYYRKELLIGRRKSTHKTKWCRIGKIIIKDCYPKEYLTVTRPLLRPTLHRFFSFKFFLIFSWWQELITSWFSCSFFRNTIPWPAEFASASLRQWSLVARSPPPRKLSHFRWEHRG